MFFLIVASFVITFAIYVDSDHNLNCLCFLEYLIVSEKLWINILVFILLLPFRAIIGIAIFTCISFINSIIFLLTIIPYYILVLFLLFKVTLRSI